MTKSQLRMDINNKFNAFLLSTFNTKSQIRRTINNIFDNMVKNNIKAS
ncbi:hypothetical protein J6Q66_09465 [bacterium]|nr:hypothetical protein [bacterium]